MLPGQSLMTWNGALRFVLSGAATSTPYTYDANGNLLTRTGQTLTWDVENHLQSVTGAGVDEQYRYDETGQRIAKTSNGVTTVYVSPAYEVANGVATTYYSFNGQRVAMRKGSVLTYLHADHLGSTLLATDEQGVVVDNNQPRYFAYGRERTVSLAALPTDYTFTGQKQDGSGLIYMNARYYDPQTGQFISPDILVPDATSLMDYDRYAYGHGNPLRYNDPSGHCVTTVLGLGADVATGGLAAVLTGVEIGVDAACWVAVTEAAYAVTNLVLAWGDKTDAVLNLAEKSANTSQQNTGGQNAGNSNTGDPNGFDPQDPWNSFRKMGMSDKGVQYLQQNANKLDLDKAYKDFTYLKDRSINVYSHVLQRAQENGFTATQIANTYTRVARNTGVFAQGGNLIVWSKAERLALVIDPVTREIETVVMRVDKQSDWQALSPFQIPTWLGGLAK